MKSLVSFITSPEQQKIEKILNEVDINSLTPLDALNLLVELQKLVKK